MTKSHLIAGGTTQERAQKMNRFEIATCQFLLTNPIMVTQLIVVLESSRSKKWVKARKIIGGLLIKN